VIASRRGAEAVLIGAIRRSLRQQTAGPLGPRRFRWLTGGLALALVSIGPGCGRSEPAARLPPILERLDRMSLVFASRISAGPRSSYFIDQFEVTNQEYARFLLESGYRPALAEAFLSRFEDPWTARFDPSLADHPVVFVSYEDALAYAAWAGKQLPDLEEWRRVALEARRDSRYFLNALSTGIGGTSRVGVFESGSTRLSSIVVPAVYDIVGNVAEWTSTRDPESGSLVVAGGSFNEQSFARPSYEEEANRNFALGFRCVLRNATAIVRELLAFMARAEAPLASDVERRLLRFGNPLARLLHHIRFEDLVRYFLDTGGRDDEIVVPLEDGRIVVLDVSGALTVFEAGNGRQVARLRGFNEFYHAVAADLDGDGQQELYLGSADPHEWAPNDWAPEIPIVADAAGELHLVNPESGRLLPWSEGHDALADVTRAAFDLDEQVDPLTGAPLLDPFGTGSHPPRTLLDQLVTPAGYVPWFHQRVTRIDLQGDQVKIGWQRSVPYSPSLIPLEATGELLVPCVLWRRYGFETEYEVAARILDVRVLGARRGGLRAAGLVAGGCQTIRPLDRLGRRFHLLASTGHELLLERTEGIFRVSRFPEPGDLLVYRHSSQGPEPYAATMLYSERLAGERQGRAGPEPEQGLLKLCLYDAGGEVAREAEFTAQGRYVPLFHVVPGLDGLVVLMGDHSLLCLNADLSPRWRRFGLAQLDLDRSRPVCLDLDRDGRTELIVQWRLDGFIRLDPETGRTLDRHVNPGPSLLRLIQAWDGDGRDLLMVGIRDEGLYSVAAPSGASDRQAVRLLDQLDPIAEPP